MPDTVPRAVQLYGERLSFEPALDLAERNVQISGWRDALREVRSN